MAAISSVTIANRALQRLGASSISSLTQGTPNPQAMNTAYDVLRRRLLRVYAWSFAKSRAVLAALTAQDPIANLNQFPLPDDFIRLLRNPGAGVSPDRRDWEIEYVASAAANCILTTDGSPIDVRYIYDAQDATKFDPLFAEALSCLLAYETCEQITGSTAKRQLLLTDLKSIIKDARYTNAIEKDADVPFADDWLIVMQANVAAPDGGNGSYYVY